MHINNTHAMTLHCEGAAEIEVMRHIVRLAAERLMATPATQLKGVPFLRRAGLQGPELTLVQDTIKRLAASTGLGLPEDVFDPPPAADKDPLGDLREVLEAVGIDLDDDHDVTVLVVAGG